MTTAPALQSIAQIAGGRLVNCVLEGIVIAAVVAILLRLMDSRNSGTRFAVWFSALLAIAGLSAISCVPSGDVAVSSSAHLNLPVAWARYAVLAWAAVAGVGLIRILIALLHVRQLRRRSHELQSSDIDPRLGQTLREFHSLRRVRLCVSDDLRVPTAIGFFKPAVLIPRWALTELSSTELNAVVLHELGHLRRWDDWTNLAQKVLHAILFFHPAMWWIGSRLTLEREMACDDLVLAKTNDARGYAECLVSVAEKSVIRSGMGLALAAVTRMRQTALRLAKILDGNRRNETRVSKPAIAMAGAVSLAALVALPYTPVLVAFTAPETSLADASYQSQPQGLKPVIYAGFHGTVKQADEKLWGDGLREGDGSKERHSFREGHGFIRAVKLQNNSALASASPVVQAKVKRYPSPSPKPLLTSYKAAEPSLSATLLLVVQTQEYDEGGVSVVTVRVLRLTVTPEQIQSQKGSVAKSI